MGMLVWINGPGGVGKTQVAHELAHRLPGSFVCDPELLGIAIQRMTPPGLRADFQDSTAWRRGVREITADLAARFDGVVLIPVTILDVAHAVEMIDAPGTEGHEVHHVCLMASRETLLRRLRSRGDGRRSYGATRIDASLAALGAVPCAVRLDTDGLGISEVAEAVARVIGLDLRPAGARLRRRLRRVLVTLRHIR